MSEQTVTRKKRRLGWLEWGFYLVAIGCVTAYGIQWYVHRTAKQAGQPSGEVLAELEPADRIPLEHGAAEGCNVLLITMDTTRADHLGCYGHQGVQTPVLDSLAKRGVLFANAFTPSPSTLPGHSSILTGLYPYHHGARANGTFHANSECTTLAEILRQAGYSTAAVISAYVLDARFGLDQGFDFYNDDLTVGVKYAQTSFRERPAPLTNEAALRWLDGTKKRPFFLWVHYFDPHAPYLPPEPFRSQYAESPYDGEIAFLDSQIGQLIAGLEQRGVADNTLIVVAADHGEGLGEHGEHTHSLLIYDSTLHTPLIVIPPKASLGKVVERQVSNVDITPTIVDLLGIETDVSFDGTSLVLGPEAHPENIYAETIATLVLHGWSPLFAVRQQDSKYIHAPTAELYDLGNDPKELTNLFGKRPEQVATLSQELDQHVGEDLFGADALAQMVNMDDETARKLGALGYVGSVTDDQLDAEGASRFDPKEMVPHFERVQNAQNMMYAGKLKEGLEELEACLTEVPDDVWCLRILTATYLEKGDMDRAEELARHALELEKNEPSIYLQLSQVSLARRNPQEAEQYLQQALTVDPQFAPAYVALGTLSGKTKGTEEALEFYQQAIEMDPGTTGPAAYNAMGTMYFVRAEFEEAREAYNKGLEIDPLNGAAHSGLAAILIEEDKLQEAEDELNIAVRFMPNDLRVLSTLAALRNKRGEYEEGLQLARRALEVNGQFPQALNSLGSALLNTGDLPGAREAFEKVLEVTPRFVPTIINLGQVYLAERREEKAVEMYERALELNPKQPIALFNIGTYKMSRGRPAEAIEFYRKAIDANPDYALAHQHLGVLLLRNNDAEAALTHLQRSLELDPNLTERERISGIVEKLRAAAEGGAEPAAIESTMLEP